MIGDFSTSPALSAPPGVRASCRTCDSRASASARVAWTWISCVLRSEICCAIRVPPVPCRSPALLRNFSTACSEALTSRRRSAIFSVSHLVARWAASNLASSWSRM